MRPAELVSGQVGAFKITLGTSPASITSGRSVPSVGATLKADDDNTDSVYIGGEAAVSVAQNGFRLKAGQALSGVMVSDLAQVWAIGGAAGQSLWVFYNDPGISS